MHTLASSGWGRGSREWTMSGSMWQRASARLYIVADCATLCATGVARRTIRCLPNLGGRRHSVRLRANIIASAIKSRSSKFATSLLCYLPVHPRRDKSQFSAITALLIAGECCIGGNYMYNETSIPDIVDGSDSGLLQRKEGIKIQREKLLSSRVTEIPIRIQPIILDRLFFQLRSYRSNAVSILLRRKFWCYLSFRKDMRSLMRQ